MHAGEAAAAETRAVADARGRHRISADLKRMEQEVKFLKEEIVELDKMEEVSALCQDLLHKVESKPDPLLSITNGPVNSSWDRWFEGPQDLRRCRCWIL